MAATLLRAVAIVAGGYALALFAPVLVPVAYTQDGPGDTCRAVYDNCLRQEALVGAAGSIARTPADCKANVWDPCMRRKCGSPVAAGQCNKDSECQRHCVETVSGQMGQGATVNCCSSLIGPDATVNPSCRQMIAGGDGALACVSDTACPTGQVRSASGCVPNTQLPQPGTGDTQPGTTPGTPGQYTAEELLQGLDDADREAGAAMIENMRREIFGDDVSGFQQELLRMGDFAADPTAPLPEGLTPQQEQAYQDFRRSWTELTQPYHLDPFTEPPSNYIAIGERTFFPDSYAPQTGFTPGSGSIGDLGSSFVGAAQDLGARIIASPPVQAIQSATQAALNAARDLARATTDSLGLTQPASDTTLVDLAGTDQDPFGTANTVTIDPEVSALGEAYLAADQQRVLAERQLFELANTTPGLSIYTGPEIPGLENLSGITVNPDGTVSGTPGSLSPLAFGGLSSDPSGCAYTCIAYGSYDESGNPIVTAYQPGELGAFAIQAAAAEAGVTGPFDVTWESTGETYRYLASDIGTIADVEGSDTYWMDTGGTDEMRTLGGAELRDTYMADVLRYSDTGEPVTDTVALERGPTTFVEEQPASFTGTADIEEYARQLGLSEAEIATLRQEAAAMQGEIQAGRLTYDEVIADLNTTLDRVETERALMDSTIFGGDLGETGGIGGTDDFPESATEKPPEVAYDEMLRGAENRLAAERDRVIEAEAALRTAEENSHPLRYAMDWTACTTGIGTCGGVPAAQAELDAARAAHDAASAEVDRIRDIPHSDLARLQAEIDASLTQAEADLARLSGGGAPSADDIIRADERRDLFVPAPGETVTASVGDDRGIIGSAMDSVSSAWSCVWGNGCGQAPVIDPNAVTDLPKNVFADSGATDIPPWFDSATELGDRLLSSPTGRTVATFDVVDGAVQDPRGLLSSGWDAGSLGLDDGERWITYEMPPSAPENTITANYEGPTPREYIGQAYNAGQAFSTGDTLSAALIDSENTAILHGLEMRRPDGSLYTVSIDSDQGRAFLAEMGCVGSCYTGAVAEARSAVLETSTAADDGGVSRSVTTVALPPNCTPGTAGCSNMAPAPGTARTGVVDRPPVVTSGPPGSGNTNLGLGSGLGVGLGTGLGGMTGIGSALQTLAQLAGMGGQQSSPSQQSAPLPPIVVQPPPTTQPQPGTPQDDALRPAIAVIASSNAIDVGETAKLIWTARRANECSARYPSGELLAEGDSEEEATSVPLFTTTTFSITCVGDAGSRTVTATVYVGEQPPASIPAQTTQPAPTIVPTTSTGGATSSPLPATSSSGSDSNYCDPALPINAFITCLSQVPGANPNSVY